PAFRLVFAPPASPAMVGGPQPGRPAARCLTSAPDTVVPDRTSPQAGGSPTAPTPHRRTRRADRRMPDRRARTRCLVPLLLGAAPRTVAQTRTPDLERLSHEELMQATVSAALGVPEPTMTTPAAAHVITGDDIRRPGATSLAEARRLAPGGWRPDSSRERDVSGCRQRRAASALLHRLLHGFLSLVVLSAIPALPSSAQPTPEYELKAAFLSKFPEFTEWPKEAIDSRPTIDLCVAAPNPFGAVLEKLA